MSEIKPIGNGEFAGIEGNYGIINQGNGYAIVNILTNKMKAHNITSYLDALKTARYLSEQDKSEEVIILETTPVSPPPSEFFDELDMATVRSMVNYFEKWPNTIRRYYQDHNATYEEAEAVCKSYLDMASQFRVVKTKEDLKKAVESVENLKAKISRFQHREHKYRWARHLQNDVLDMLNFILSKSCLGDRLNTPDFNVSEDVRRLIEKYAPETKRVKKKSNFLGYTWYKCYDKSGNVLGRVRGSSGDRYWQYGGLDDQKLY